ncbi:MAG: TetR family transcriptional regulator [Microbacteriaceae bacterium]|nr:TetR family transcriptional regulator [Microbacteriaceae bacterium]
MPLEAQSALRGTRRGRRAGHGDTRLAILKAASSEFLSRGYDSTSMRGIAKVAGVDPALVHHYFASKADLFAETISAPVRPDRIVREVLAGPRELIGVNLVRAALTNLDKPSAQKQFIGLLRTALSHDFAATILRQFMTREVVGKLSKYLDVPDGDFRATAAASQLVGLFVIRYGVKFEPLAKISVEDAALHFGPIIQWHLTGSNDPIDMEQSPRE